MKQPVLTAEPWGILTDGAAQTVGSDQRSMLSGLGRPRLFMPADAAVPRFGAHRAELPRASFPFVWGGQVLQAYELPTPHLPIAEPTSFSATFHCDTQAFACVQTGVRGPADKDHPSSESEVLRAWIGWQVHVFQSLAAPDQFTSLAPDQDAAFGSVTRRSWQTIRHAWTEPGDDPARMALIVSLANDRNVENVLDSVSRHPRRVLERVRQPTRLDRIEQLDAACIRDYARRPGWNAAQKAGPRQELLAVRRRENMNTLENRVTDWVLRAAQEMAREYARDYGRFSNSDKLRAVRRLDSNLTQWRRRPDMAEISSLHLEHPVRPNYPLQFDARYRRVHRAYLQILHEQKVIDDAWQWQRVLWADTSRQLLASVLTEVLAPKFQSHAYVRHEAIQGRWSLPPMTPGPFLDTKPDQACHVLDSWDLNNPARSLDGLSWIPGAKYLGASGCDQILWLPHKRRMLLVWHQYWLGDRTAIQEQVQHASESLAMLREDIRRFDRQSLELVGLMLMPQLHPQVSQPTTSWLACSTMDHDRLHWSVVPTGEVERLKSWRLELGQTLSRELQA